MQDKAIVHLGKLKLLEMGDKKPYELFIQNMFPEKDNYDMILAVFELKSEEDNLICTFEKVDIDKVNKRNFEKYAYRKGSARGGDITFTTKFGDIEKKFRTLVDNQFKNLNERLTLTTLGKEFNIFNSVYQFLLQKENFEAVKSALSTIYESLGKEQKLTSGLSLMFVIDGEEKYLADFEIIQQILYSSGTEEKSEKYDVKSEGKNAICSICLEKKETLHGFASPFKYATVDKPGMVSGFFNQKSNWKNYPICIDCSLSFELGRAYITNNLSSYFYGNPFYMIPKVLISKDLQNLVKASKRIKEIYDNLSENSQKIRRREEYIWEMIATDEDYFNLNLLFYEENPTTKAIKIKLMLEEIVPSRFKKLFVDVPQVINSNPLYLNSYTIKKEPQNLTFSFGLLKTFFSDSFLDIVQKVFMLHKISSETLYAKFMQVIRENYNKSQTSDGYVEIPYLTVLKTHLVIAYLQKIKIIEYNHNFNVNITMESTEEITKDEKESGFNPIKIQEFLTKNQGFLDSNAKIGVFMLGVFIQHVLNVQYFKLNKSSPFEKKLKGYNLNAPYLQNIYYEALGKLSQYDSTPPPKMMNFVNEYYVLNVHQIQKMSNNEVSFYFVAGIQFSNQFKFPKSEETKK